MPLHVQCITGISYRLHHTEAMVGQLSILVLFDGVGPFLSLVGLGWERLKECAGCIVLIRKDLDCDFN